jgi:uncharacterized protein
VSEDFNYQPLESVIAQRMKQECDQFADPSHDFLHVQRVVAMAKKIGIAEKAKLAVVVPAAYLHDFVLIAKNDPRRAQASQISAEAAAPFLRGLGFPETLIAEILHAIAAHSFSAGIEAQTLEAKFVQDADRLDALGAIGAMRCFAASGLLQRPFYSEDDPFCRERVPNDKANSLDHFFIKLFKGPSMLHTETGRHEGMRRIRFLQLFAEQLGTEIELRN